MECPFLETVVHLQKNLTHLTLMLQTSAFHSVCHHLATSEEKTAQKTAWPPLEHVTAGIRKL
jgi:hypothetical protein